MTPDQIEMITIQNAQAIATLTEIAKSTSSDVDRVVKHMESNMALAEKVSNLDRRVGILEGKMGKVLWALVTYLIGIVGYLLSKSLTA